MCNDLPYEFIIQGVLMNIKKIIDDVLMDIRREDDDVIEFLDKQPCYDDMKPIDKVELYHLLSYERPDAERRHMALQSYLQYPFIKAKDQQYRCENDYLYYRDQIKITADLLTGSKEIISHAEYLKSRQSPEQEIKELEQVLEAFCRVVYTIGNCCPVMKNKGGRKGKVGGLETCWYKLNNYVDINNKYESITELFTGELKTNLQLRKADNMFVVFSEKMIGKDIVINLLLRDFYDTNFSLIETRNPNEINTISEYIDLLILCTKLIVQRGLRICLGHTQERFDNEQKCILIKIFEEIGLPKKENGYLLTYEKEGCE